MCLIGSGVTSKPNMCRPVSLALFACPFPFFRKTTLQRNMSRDPSKWASGLLKAEVAVSGECPEGRISYRCFHSGCQQSNSAPGKCATKHHAVLPTLLCNPRQTSYQRAQMTANTMGCGCSLHTMATLAVLSSLLL